MGLDFSASVDLAKEEFGGTAFLANDEFFAEKENLLKPGRGIFIPDKYTDRGKWMDGWETRRRRTPGHDWCIVRLAFPGVVHGLDIDTNFFTGNHPPFASVEGIDSGESPVYFERHDLPWFSLLEKSPLLASSQNLFAVKSQQRCTHVRLNIFPDGGVARLRVYGDVVPDWRAVQGEVVELSAVQYGGRALSCSDMFYSDRGNLLKPGRGKNMGDGWETKRRRGPGHDWVIIKLGHAGVIEKMEIDTAHFKGNYPDRFAVEGLFQPGAAIPDASTKGWTALLGESKLQANLQHFFTREIKPHQPVTHLRLNIFPDGGVSRFRAYGKLARG